MCHTLKIFICLLLTTTYTKAQGSLQTFKCEIEGNKCVLTGITTNWDQTGFGPLATDPNNIQRISIENSTIPILDESICLTFPTILEIDIINSNIEQIQANAFSNCSELKAIKLDQNKITGLLPNTFEANPKLEGLSIKENQLSQLDRDVFRGAENLVVLILGSNMIKTLDPEIFANTRKLENLDLHNNELSDLDIEAILKHTASLKNINLRHNSFKCERLSAILKVLKEKTVDLGKSSISGLKSKYKNEWIDDIECDNDGKAFVMEDVKDKKREKGKEKKEGRNGAILERAQIPLIVFITILGRFITY